MGNNPQDLLNKLSTDDLSKYSNGNLNDMSTDGLKIIASLPEENTNKGNDIASNAIGVGALGGAVAAAYGGGRFLNTPNRLMKPIDAQLENIAKTQIGKQVATSDLPSLLTAKYNQFKADTVRPSLDLINQNTKTQAASIKNNRNLFDQQVINPAVEDTAKHIASNYKTFTNSAYQQYRQAQNLIESSIEQSGQSLNPDDISNNLLNKTISDSIQKGVPESQLGKLKQLASYFDGEGDVKDLIGNKMNVSDPIPFSQIKGNVGYLLNELPDNAKHILSDNWNSYMGKYVPAPAKEIYDTMQAKYAQFAPARNALYDLIDKDSGIFDTKKLSTRLRMFVKTNQDAGLTDLLGVLKNGTDITQPIPGLSQKVDGLSTLANHRNDYANQLVNLEKTKQTAMQGAQQIEDVLNKGKQDYTSISRQTEELLSQKNALMDKYPMRTMISNAPKALVKGLFEKAIGMGGKLAVGIPYGVVGSELQNRSVGYDPADAFKAWYTGTFGNPMEKQKMQQDLQDKANAAMQT